MVSQEQRLALLAEKRKRRDELALQDARKGYDSPPHIKVELAELNAEITALEAEDVSLFSSELLDQLGAVGRIQLLLSEIKHFKQNIFERLDREREDIRDRFDTWERTQLRTQAQTNTWLVGITITLILLAMAFVYILARGSV